jgi:hypothetical protein
MLYILGLLDDMKLAYETKYLFSGFILSFLKLKKNSLLDSNSFKIEQDCQDPIELLRPKNINTKALLEYIRDACDYCTDYQVSVLFPSLLLSG